MITVYMIYGIIQYLMVGAAIGVAIYNKVKG